MRPANRLPEKMSLESLHDYNRLLLDDYHNCYRPGNSIIPLLTSGDVRRIYMAPGLLQRRRLAGHSSGLTGAARRSCGRRGALSGYLSRTYLRVYERTLVQLNQYYRQPLLNSYLLSAERILRDVNEPDLKAAMYGRLLTQIITSAGALDDLFTTDALGVIGLGDDRRGVRHGRNPDSDSSRDNAAGRASGD